jgi:site-specific recombinase XerD
VIAAFLNHLERDRGNSARTRNLWLTAVRSLFRYAAPRARRRDPARPGDPGQRYDRRAVTYLTAQESQALIDAPLAGSLGRPP